MGYIISAATKWIKGAQFCKKNERFETELDAHLASAATAKTALQSYRKFAKNFIQATPYPGNKFLIRMQQPHPFCRML